MSCVAIIPARGGSTRIPRKNAKLFHGKPIIAYSITAAQDSGLFDQIIVSTDDGEIAEIARECGAHAHLRDAALCADHVGTQFVTACVLREFPEHDYACCIYATAPLMSAADLSAGRRALLSDATVSHVISVGYPPLSDAAQFYWSRAHALLVGIEYFDARTRVVKIARERVCDINTPEDWAKAEAMYQELMAMEWLVRPAA